MVIIKTLSENGPYFDISRGKYQAARLKEMVFHCRLAMEDREDLIGIYDAEGQCKGIWSLTVEGHRESDGTDIIDHEAYELMRPSTPFQTTWKYLQNQLAF